MLLTLLALLSSTTLLVGAVLAARLQHSVLGVYVLAVAIGLLLAASNLWTVHKAGFLWARATQSKPEARQNLIGKAFCAVSLLWAVCAEPVGFWVTSSILRLLH